MNHWDFQINVIVTNTNGCQFLLHTIGMYKSPVSSLAHLTSVYLTVSTAQTTQRRMIKEIA
jgi:hypothetical protein